MKTKLQCLKLQNCWKKDRTMDYKVQRQIKSLQNSNNVNRTKKG